MNNNDLEEIKVETRTCYDLLEHYKVVALTLYKAHKNSSKFNNRIAMGYVIFTILISNALGNSSLSLLFDEYRILKIMNVVLSYLVLVVGLLYRQFKPDEKQRLHNEAAEKYIKLYYHIAEILIFNQIAIDNVKDVNQRLEDMRKNSPLINDDLYDKYKAICSNVRGKHKKLII